MAFFKWQRMMRSYCTSPKSIWRYGQTNFDSRATTVIVVFGDLRFERTPWWTSFYADILAHIDAFVDFQWGWQAFRLFPQHCGWCDLHAPVCAWEGVWHKRPPMKALGFLNWRTSCALGWALEKFSLKEQLVSRTKSHPVVNPRFHTKTTFISYSTTLLLIYFLYI